jgi:hypothetical protein
MTGPFALTGFTCGPDVGTDSLSATDITGATGPTGAADPTPFATVAPGQTCAGAVEFLDGS